MSEQLVEHMHLAELIEDEMRERGWGEGEAALDRLTTEGCPYPGTLEWSIRRLAWDLFFEVREPNVLLGEKMAGELSRAFDVDPQFFLNFHEAWRVSRASDSASKGRDDE